MKKLIVLSLLAVLSQLVHAQKEAFDKIVSRYQSKGLVKMNLNGDFDFSSDINKNVSAKIEGVSLNMARVKSKQTGVHLVILGDEAKLQNADFQTLVSDFKQAGYEDLMTVRKGKSNVSFLDYERNNRFNNLAMLIRGENGGAVLLSFKGDYSRKDVNAILDGK